MQAQLRQAGGATGGQLSGRRLGRTDRQQRRIDTRNLPEQLLRSPAHPPLAKIYPGRLVPAEAVHVAGVYGLLEQGNAGLVPQPVPEQGRGISADGQRQGGHQLEGIEGVGVGAGVDPVVHLERGIGALQGDVRHVELEGILAVDIDPEPVAAPLDQLLHQGVVAAPISDAVGAEIRLPQGGQDADGHDATAMGGRHCPQLFQPGQYLALGGQERRLVQAVGRQVVLQVVAVQFQGETGIRRIRQDLLVGEQRATGGVDDIHLQFRPQGSRAPPEPGIRQQRSQRVEILIEAPAEGPVIVRGKFNSVDVYAHGDLL